MVISAAGGFGTNHIVEHDAGNLLRADQRTRAINVNDQSFVDGRPSNSGYSRGTR